MLPGTISLKLYKMASNIAPKRVCFVLIKELVNFSKKARRSLCHCVYNPSSTSDSSNKGHGYYSYQTAIYQEPDILCLFEGTSIYLTVDSKCEMNAVSGHDSAL